MLRSLISILLLIATTSIAFGSGGEVTTVSLRVGVRIDEGSTITLSAIADLDGPLSESLGLLVVEPDTGTLLDGRGRGTIGVDRVRELVLDGAEESAVVVRGTSCHVQIRRQSRPPTHQPLVHTPDPSIATLRDQISAHIRAMLGVTQSSIRLEFEDRDERLLNTPIEGRVVEVRATGMGRRVPVSVAVYQGTELLTEGTVRVGVTVLRSVAVLRTEQARGVAITADHVRAEERWVSIDDKSLSPDDSIGQVTRRRIRGGETLSAPQLEPPIAIHRGDVVMVRSLVGAASVHLRARALEDGRLGESVELEQTTGDNGRPSRRRITATVLAPGRAMIGSSLKTSTEAP